DPAVAKGPAWRAAEVPAVNGHGTARGAAGLYAALLQGGLLSPALLREASTAQCSGTDVVLGEQSAWGLGFGVDADGYGMGGSGGSFAGASAAGGDAFAVLTGTEGSHDRATGVGDAPRRFLGGPPPPGPPPSRALASSRVPLLTQQPIQQVVGPLALGPGALAQVSLAAHAQLFQDGGRRQISRIAACGDPVLAPRGEQVAHQQARRF